MRQAKPTAAAKAAAHNFLGASPEEIAEYRKLQELTRNLPPPGAEQDDDKEDDKPNSAARARFADLAALQKFLHGGKAIVTVVSKQTRQRFTYRFAQPKADPSDTRVPPTFISVLTGPDNNTQYVYMGSMFANRPDPLQIVHTAKSHIGKDAPSAKAAQWFVRAVAAGGPVLEQCEVWHEGRCGRCGRRLTVPESIASGFGPECINHV